MFDASTNKVSLVGKIPTHGKTGKTNGDAGLTGIALHPDFKNNRWVYLYNIPPAKGKNPRHMILARYEIDSSNRLVMDSKKVLIDIYGNREDRWHFGGPMQFDSFGDLWVVVGNNSIDGSWYSEDSVYSDEWGASSTASMRGGVIRIHPDSSEKGYSIPKNNFAEYWANKFEDEGNLKLAQEYRNPKKVLPEIYTKGSRSNFSISTHPTKRWATFGEVNPGSNDDEFHLLTHPQFTGYPYFFGNNKATKKNLNPASPMNRSPP